MLDDFLSVSNDSMQNQLANEYAIIFLATSIISPRASGIVVFTNPIFRSVFSTHVIQRK